MPFRTLFCKPISSAIVSLRHHHSAHLVPGGGPLITMINQKASKRRSDANEVAVKQQFKNLNYSVKRLDTKSSKRRRPDFLISNASGPLLLCEVKTVDSGGYPRDKSKYGVAHVHISTLDDKLRSFQNIPITRIKIDEGLSSAVRKREALVKDEPHFADLPLLVAFFFDFFADYLYSYPPSFAERDATFREVSGILAIKKDFARSKAFMELSDEEQERRVKAEWEGDTKVNDDLPPHSTDFVLFRNEAASREVPEASACQCLPSEAYYQ